jgi:glycosyltransferase involved in cell wall biosynthesis
MTAHTILVIAGHSTSLMNFRGELLRAMRARGNTVVVAAPGLLDDQSTFAALSAMGITCHDLALSRTGLNPIADLRTFANLRHLMRQVRPDLVLAYTIKPVIWGMLAAARASVAKRVSLITGLGYAFTGQARGKRRVIQMVARRLYRLALSQATLVFFQNQDDRQVFRDLNLLSLGTPSEVVNGSGVDTVAFAPADLPRGSVRFLMIARLLGDKGVREYAAAARQVRVRHPGVQFDLVGALDTNPDSIRREEVEAWCQAGDLNWLGEQRDVRPAIARCHVYVLPSYREGTPRTVLEAMAMARAVITTDAPGCRDTTIAGENGFLVPVADVAALVTAMEQFLLQPELAHSMGLASRRRAEDKYDVRKVNVAMLTAMGL